MELQICVQCYLHGVRIIEKSFETYFQETESRDFSNAIQYLICFDHSVLC